jgi:hypothetical protein
MKNQNPVFITMLFAVAFALAPVTEAKPYPDGGPTYGTATAGASSANLTSPEGENLPVITIHNTDNVTRGKTGSFVLDMKPRLMFGGTWVNFSIDGTAVPGVDYVPLISPAYIGQSGYGTILVQTLPDPRASSSRQAYSVVVTLEAGAGYAVGASNSATLWIKP